MEEDCNQPSLCSSCEQTKEYMIMLKEKIIVTDKLIKKYEQKREDCDEQIRKVAELEARLEENQRSKDAVQAQLEKSQKICEPLRKNVTRLNREKTTAEAKVLELQEKFNRVEGMYRKVLATLQAREKSECSWKLEQQIHAKELLQQQQSSKRKEKTIAKLQETLTKQKELNKEKSRELTTERRKSKKLEQQLQNAKEEIAKVTQELKKIKTSPGNTAEAPTPTQRRKRRKRKPVSAASHLDSETAPTSQILEEFRELSRKLAFSPLPASPPRPTGARTSLNSSTSSSSSSCCNSDDEESGSLSFPELDVFDDLLDFEVMETKEGELESSNDLASGDVEQKEEAGLEKEQGNAFEDLDTDLGCSAANEEPTQEGALCFSAEATKRKYSQFEHARDEDAELAVEDVTCKTESAASGDKRPCFNTKQGGNPLNTKSEKITSLETSTEDTTILDEGVSGEDFSCGEKKQPSSENEEEGGRLNFQESLSAETLEFSEETQKRTNKEEKGSLLAKASESCAETKKITNETHLPCEPKHPQSCLEKTDARLFSEQLQTCEKKPPGQVNVNAPSVLSSAASLPSDLSSVCDAKLTEERGKLTETGSSLGHSKSCGDELSTSECSEKERLNPSNLEIGFGDQSVQRNSGNVSDAADCRLIPSAPVGETEKSSEETTGLFMSEFQMEPLPPFSPLSESPPASPLHEQLSPSDAIRAILSDIDELRPLSPIPPSPPKCGVSVRKRKSQRKSSKRKRQEILEATEHTDAGASSNKKTKWNSEESYSIGELNVFIVNISQKRTGKKKGKLWFPFSVRRPNVSEEEYAVKCVKRLQFNNLQLDEAVERLSDNRCLSSSIPLASAVVHSLASTKTDLLPGVLKQYNLMKRRSEVSGQWKAVLSDFEARLVHVIFHVSKTFSLRDLVLQVINEMSKAILLPSLNRGDVNCFGIASQCRFLTALCRMQDELCRMRVICHDIVHTLHNSPVLVLHALFAVSSVWPAVLKPDSPDQIYTLTLRFVTLKWFHDYPVVKFSRVLLWLCGWEPILINSRSLEQLADGLVGILKDCDAVNLDRDGTLSFPDLSFEAIKCLQLLSCVLGWDWTRDALIAHSVWGVLNTWASQTSRQSFLNHSSSREDIRTIRNPQDNSEHSVREQVSTGILQTPDSANAQVPGGDKETEVNFDSRSSIDCEQTEHKQVLVVTDNHGHRTETCEVKTTDMDVRMHGVEPEADQSVHVAREAKFASEATSSSCADSVDLSVARGGSFAQSETEESETTGCKSGTKGAGLLQSECEVMEVTQGTTGACLEENRNTRRTLEGEQCRVSEATVVSLIRLLGGVCRASIHQSPAVELLDTLEGLLKLADTNSQVTYLVQFATALSLLDLSPWQPKRVIRVLDQWLGKQLTRGSPQSISVIGNRLACLKGFVVKSKLLA